MHIFDCIVFTDELGALRDRMKALEDIPEVIHVICEAPVYLNGDPKPLYFWENRWGLFFPWYGRWNHVRVEASEISGDTPGERERSLRSFLPQGLNGNPDDDIILDGNLAEIPDPAEIRDLAAS